MIIKIDSKTTTFNMCIQASLSTIPERKLHNIKQINIISDASIVSEVSKGELKILYVFAKPINLSTCTLLEANLTISDNAALKM